ncbi:MarR family winged helix-turn-helix transcriptional regulator [Streptomyces sp. NPDC002156]
MSVDQSDLAVGTDEVEALEQLLNAARLLTRGLNEILAEDGLTVDLWRIMHVLAKRPGLLMGEVAKSLTIPNATTTRLVNQLVDSGLAYRKPHVDDSRKAVVYLSRTGRERLARATSLVGARRSTLPAFAHLLDASDMAATTRSTAAP